MKSGIKFCLPLAKVCNNIFLQNFMWSEIIMSEILEGVLSEFEKISAIPRPSKHEEQISNYLKKYLSDMNFVVEQDGSKNIIAEIPATPGREIAPLTILQAHMDMVCVAEESYNYNALTDSIKLIRTEDFLQAEGTSLGADDGIGVAEILYLAKNHKNFSHGKIRIIFTTDEEQGMSGAINISDKYFKDVKFLISCDSEVYDELVVGSAGSVRVDFTKKINFVEPDETLQNSYRIKISGLRGGHSGIEIAAHRANAIKMMRNFLRLVKGRGNFQVAKTSGGAAVNAIPCSAEAVIVTSASMENLHDCTEMLKFQIKNKYEHGEPNFKITFENVERPEKVFSTKNFSEFTNLITIVHSGVYALSDTILGMVETSANIGMVRTEGDILRVSLLARSHVNDMLSEFVTMYNHAGAMTNFEVTCDSPSPTWESNPASFLTRIMAKIFKEQNNSAMKIHAIHAGLECGYFYTKNKNLDIVSIGTTNENIHSPQEKLHLKTVEPQVNLLISTLAKISELED